MKPLKSYHLLVEGKVQGVFFRASTKDTADALNVKGWVKNTREGAVEIVCLGEETTLNQFINWCKAGPSQARVDNVKIAEIDAANFDGFTVVKGY